MKKDPKNKPYNQKKVEKCLNELKNTANNVFAFADESAAVQGAPSEVGMMIVAAMIADPAIHDVIVAAAVFSKTEEYRLLKEKALQAVKDNKNLN